MISKGIELVITAKNAMATGIASAGKSIAGLGPMIRNFTKLALGPIAAVSTAFYAVARAANFVNDMIQAQGKRYRELEAANVDQEIEAITKAYTSLKTATAEATKAEDEQRKMMYASIDATKELLAAQRELKKQEELNALAVGDESGRSEIESRYGAQSEMDAEQKKLTESMRKLKELQENAPRDLAAAENMKALAEEARARADSQKDLALSYTKMSNEELKKAKETSWAIIHAIKEKNAEMYTEEANAATARSAKAMAVYKDLREAEKQYRDKVADYAKKSAAIQTEIEARQTDVKAKQVELRTDAAKAEYESWESLEKKADERDKAKEDRIKVFADLEKAAADEIAKAEKERARAIEDAADKQRKANEDRIDALEKILSTTKEIADASIEDIMASKRAAEEKKKQEADERRRAQDIADRLAYKGLRSTAGAARRIGERDPSAMRTIGSAAGEDVRKVGERLSSVSKQDKEFLKTFNERQKARSFADEKLKNIEKLLDDNLKLG